MWSWVKAVLEEKVAMEHMEVVEVRVPVAEPPQEQAVSRGYGLVWGDMAAQAAVAVAEPVVVVDAVVLPSALHS